VADRSEVTPIEVEANAEALRRVSSASPFLVDIKPAGEVIPELGEKDLLHAGPPLSGWEEACGALRGAVIGTLIHLGFARNPEEAESLAGSGEFRLVSANDHCALGTYAGVIARATKLFVVEDRLSGHRAYAAINEGRGKALRYGSYDPETLARLAWLEGQFAEILATGIRKTDGIDLFELLVQALHMGDDGHSRQKAASALFANTIAPHLIGMDFEPKELVRVLRFLTQTEIFFLPLAMAAAKATMLSAEGIPGSTMITCMAGNGVRWGIKISGCGPQWFTAPVPSIQGRYFEGYGPQDASPVIGDSEIAETMGLGAFAMTAAPALAPYIGGTLERAKQLALKMYKITLAEHPRFKIPPLEYRGTPMGIDVRRVVDTGIEPIFNTGIAHKDPGVGQIGAGFGHTPMACCVAALETLQAIPSRA
jgi:Protein of unknown function (DUF1116)